MAERIVDYNKVADYNGLEILLTAYLKQIEYKSDLVILLSHYILTYVLNYDCVVRKGDPYLGDDVEYEIIDGLPIDWNQLAGSYKLTYKKGETIKIVSGMKQNNSFVLYVLKENGDRDQLSMAIPLKHYIPDEFFIVDHGHYMELRSVQVREIMNIITSTVLGNKKYKFKELFNSDLNETSIQEIMLNKDDEEVTPNLRNDLDDVAVGTLIPPRCKTKEEEEQQDIGDFHLQDPNRHKPKDVTDDDFPYDHPDYYMQEDLDGPPTSSLYS